jgi:predicted transporter
LLRKVVAGLAILLGLYLVVRAVVEPFVIDVSDPATYRDDWGGPSLLGVLAIHCGPGLLVLVGLCIVLLRRRRSPPGT